MTVRPHRLVATLGVLGSLAVAMACAKRGPRDVGNQNPRSEFADGPGETPRRDGGRDGAARVLATPSLAGVKPRALAKANSRAIAIDGSRVYYGDSEDDGLYAVAKDGGEPTKVARRAPMPAALSVTGTMLAWIGTPGDTVLRIATSGGPPATVRDHGLFTAVVTSGSDVFTVEADGAGGVLTRSSASTAGAVRLAVFDGSPRAAVADSDRVYVATSTGIVAVAKAHGETALLAHGMSFAHPAIDEAWVYATVPTAGGRARSVVRVPKTGGTLESVASDVRDAPIAVHGGSVYWFDAERPALLAAAPGSPPRTIAEDEAFAQPSGLAIDGDGAAFVAAGFAEEGRILVVSSADGGAP